MPLKKPGKIFQTYFRMDKKKSFRKLIINVRGSLPQDIVRTTNVDCFEKNSYV